jgi:hypothetical protein
MFLNRYPVDLSEAAQPDAGRYDSFNDFFTRRLRAGARPLDADPSAALCPADGTLSQCGRIAADTLLQAKGIEYSAAALLGGDAAMAAEFAGGEFATVYLAPHNYHRVHMPLAGTLRRARFVPGDLFSVNESTAASVPNLFARNERIACVFDTAAGPFAFPTTTPVQFDPQALHGSIDRLLSYRPERIALTHYGPVGDDLERMGADLHECIDEFVRIARRHAAEPDRRARIAADMFERFSERLDRHGFEGDGVRRHELLDSDVDLNTQGLDVWLRKV